jgi:hypothetical protein
MDKSQSRHTATQLVSHTHRRRQQLSKEAAALDHGYSHSVRNRRLPARAALFLGSVEQHPNRKVLRLVLESVRGRCRSEEKVAWGSLLSPLKVRKTPRLNPPLGGGGGGRVRWQRHGRLRAIHFRPTLIGARTVPTSRAKGLAWLLHSPQSSETTSCRGAAFGSWSPTTKESRSLRLRESVETIAEELWIGPATVGGPSSRAVAEIRLG